MQPALIIKYLDKPVAFNLFKLRMAKIWNLQGRMDMIDVGSGCFVVRFSTADDCKRVLLDGTWKLFDNYVVAQRWRPDFDPKTSKLEKMPVWVRLPGLPVEYYRDDVLKLISQQVGTPLKLDKMTADVERGRFARAAVEIDLSKPLVSMVKIRRRVQHIEYEGIHVICFTCGEVGHRSERCGKTTVDMPNTPMGESSQTAESQESKGPENSRSTEIKDKFGPWMVVGRKPKHASKNSNGQWNKFTSRKGEPMTNKFALLQSEDGQEQGTMSQGIPLEKEATVEKATDNTGKENTDALNNESITGSFSFMQGLDGLRDTPIWVEGEVSRLMGKGDGERGKTKHARAKKIGRNKGVSRSSSGQRKQVPENHGHGEMDQEAFVFGKTAFKDDDRGQRVSHHEERDLGLGTHEGGGGQTPSPVPMDQ